MSQAAPYPSFATTDFAADEIVKPVNPNNSPWNLFNDPTGPGGNAAASGLATIFRIATSVRDFPSLDIAEAPAPSVEALPTCEVPHALASIRHAFSLSTIELAKVFGVSRRAVYDWIEGGTVKEANRQRITAIQAFADYWQETGAGRLGSLVRESVDGKVLLNLLTAPELEEARIHATLDNLADRLNAREKARKLPTVEELRTRHGSEPLSASDHGRNVKAAFRAARRRS